MKILKSNFEMNDIGLFLETKSVYILFGNKNSSVASIQTTFPDLHLHRIKQTHSDIIVPSSDTPVEADGHFTQTLDTALIISTADCTPVLIHCLQTKKVCAVHAGWKGVANQIVFKTLKHLITTGSTQKQFDFWIGPHILQNSFEVDEDVLQQLEDSAFRSRRADFCYEKNGKFHVDLKKIIYSQIQKVIGDEFAVTLADFDTKTDDRFWSFRRDKEQAGRNLSFIALK